MSASTGTGKRAGRAAAAASSVITPEPDAEGRLPPGCPVTPLGQFSATFFYLDSRRQLAALPARDHSRLGLLGLFSDHAQFLYSNFPRMSKEGVITGWRPELVAEALIGAAGRKGIWNPADRERGRGAWRGERGELVLHTGRVVLTFAPTPNAWADKLRREPGVIGRHVYPAGEDAGVPADAVAGGSAQDLLAALQTWPWRRGEIDAVLLLGWIGAAIIGGALDWRAIVWVTAEKGSGKSTLHDLVGAVFDGALIKLAETSEAYVRQKLKHETLPVVLDEAESEEDNRKLNALVKLARIAASGGVLGRGGADHSAVDFTMRSAFLFGSILMPPLLSQDRSRIAVLELDEMARDATRPDVSRERWAPIGAQLRRRMVDGWHRWQRTLDHFREALGEAGHSKRGQDQYGTLLAAADMLLHDGEAGGDVAHEWVQALRADTLSEVADDEPDFAKCIKHLLNKSVDPFRNGGLKSLGEWLRIAAGWDAGDAVQAQQVLQRHGLKLRDTCLLIANSHPSLGELFRETHWSGRSGAVGVWVQAMRRLPEAEQTGAVYFAGVTCRATRVPLRHILVRHDPDQPQRTLEPV